MNDDEYLNQMFDDGPVFGAEVNAIERVGMGGKLTELLSGVGLPDEEKKGKELSPEDRFLTFTDATARNLISEGILRITDQDINKILEKTKFVSGLRYKNPVAYILGYVASEGGRSLKPDIVKNVINKVLPQIGDRGGVTGPDVVRYARYWTMYL